ncbi:hypothetical protein SAMN05428947_103311 [Mucilaginibacter sp. OK283]|jgi:hypothetical protein|nr:hypothetical protein SAMN05428947_103311 [Mucilaginibacter sp. OK283]
MKSAGNRNVRRVDAMIKYPVNYKDIQPDIDFYSELPGVYRKAEKYLLDFKWCAAINDSFLYYNLGEVFCIFLFEIDNTQSQEDNFLWVIVGDIPSMYLDVYGPDSTVEVLEDYIHLAEDWIAHVKSKQSVDECYPFNAEPTIELAELLEKKVSFMKNTLLNEMEDISLKRFK